MHHCTTTAMSICLEKVLVRRVSMCHTHGGYNWVPLRHLQKVCLEALVLSFADFNKLFLLETDASKLGLGAVLSQKQTDG